MHDGPSDSRGRRLVRGISAVSGDGPEDRRARVAIDLGAESCRVSLLRWQDGEPRIDLIHRTANGPVRAHGCLCWPFAEIFSALEDGLRKAAAVAAESIASIAVDGWAVDYVRLGDDGLPLAEPYCYRDERTVAAKDAADRVADPAWMFRCTGAQPLRINTAYQLVADAAAGIDARAPWINLPEYVLHRLGGRRVAEYTNATHSGLVDLQTGEWSDELIETLGLDRAAFPPIVATGSAIGKLSGELARLDAYRDTELIVPACHDTASAIAGIASYLADTAYICSGTWSLVGARVAAPIATDAAMRAGFTNQGAAGEGFCFHANVNGMWMLKQCLESWRKDGRSCELQTLVADAARCGEFPGVVQVDDPALLLGEEMPARLNERLRDGGFASIEDCAGNEPVFARVIFESLAARYAEVLENLKALTSESFRHIHILGGGSQNQLLTRLTAERTGLAVEVGHAESSTVGNFAVQLAAAEANGPPRAETIRQWSQRLCGAR